MTEPEIEILKDSIGKTVEIETVDEEHLIAGVLFVTHDEEYEEHDVLYGVVSSNLIGSYEHLDDSNGYTLDFGNTLSVRPYSELGTKTED